MYLGWATSEDLGQIHLGHFENLVGGDEQLQSI